MLWKRALITVLVILAGAAVVVYNHHPKQASVAAPKPSPSGSVALAKPHVAVIVLENKEDSDVLGSPQAPFINKLAAQGAVATNAYGVTHPSLPNYLALVGGSTYGITSDCTDCSASGQNLGTQLSAAGVSWKAYVEGYPGSCNTTGDGYAKKHVPFLYFSSITGDQSECAHIVPLTQLASDESSGAMPSFVWITPNLCHDMHDCDVPAGDSFLSQLVPPLSKALGPRGIVLLTWDEGATNAGCCGGSTGGRIPLILSGGGVKSGATTATAYDHYAELRFLEERYGLSALGQAAARPAASLSELIK